MICSICTATAVDCKSSSYHFCPTCAYNEARKFGITVDEPDFTQSEARVRWGGEEVALIQWYMGDTRLEFAPGKIPEKALPYIKFRMIKIQEELACLPRP